MSGYNWRKYSRRSAWVLLYAAGALLVLMPPAPPIIQPPEETRIPAPPAQKQTSLSMEERPQTVTSPVSGVDVSHYQGKVDWREVRDAGVSFIYLKSTDGVTYTDPKYDDNATAIRQ